jgi:hypothetical protein
VPVALGDWLLDESDGVALAPVCPLVPEDDDCPDNPEVPDVPDGDALFELPVTPAAPDVSDELLDAPVDPVLPVELDVPSCDPEVSDCPGWAD